MDRRALLLSLLTGPALLGDMSESAAQGGAPDPSVYIPKAHLVEDRAFLHAFMDEFSFVDLVTTTPTLRITHIPSVLDRASGQFGTLFGHISAQNDQKKAVTGGERAVVVFRGPHGYVSPGWLATPAGKNGVPTWNFAVVHATGRMVPIDEPARKHALLAALIKKYEARIGGTDYDFAKLPMDEVLTRMKGIRPLSLEIEALEGKFKLFQERPAPDRQAMLPKLEAYKERSLHDFTQYFYTTAPK
ncbi:MAG: FMN-binding negative transcriptional regulator [Acidobacteriota bacterium]